jgi:hypothetical protein
MPNKLVRKLSGFLLFVGSLLALTLPVAEVKAQYSGGTGSNIPGLAANGSNLTATVPILLPDGTFAAPALGFTSDPTLGFYKVAGATAIVFRTGGVATTGIAGGYLRVCAACTLGFSPTTDPVSGIDVALVRDAANTLALRNSTNAQTFNVYNTYTDGANYERLSIYGTAGAAFNIKTQSLGSGTARGITIDSADYLVLNSPNGKGVYLRTNSGAGVYYNTSIFQPESSDVVDLGTSAKLFANAYLSRSIQGSKSKALTESSATAAWDCALAAGAHTGGTLKYCVYAADATDQQERCADIRVAAVNKAGTTTCGLTTVTGNTTVNETTDANAAAINSGTLTYAVTCSDTTDSFAISFNAVSSLTQTTLQSESRWDIMTPATCTPQ